MYDWRIWIIGDDDGSDLTCFMSIGYSLTRFMWIAYGLNRFMWIAYGLTRCIFGKHFYI